MDSGTVGCNRIIPGHDNWDSTAFTAEVSRETQTQMVLSILESFYLWCTSVPDCSAYFLIQPWVLRLKTWFDDYTSGQFRREPYRRLQ